MKALAQERQVYCRCLNEDTQLVHRQFRACPVRSSLALSAFKCALLFAHAVRWPCDVRHIGLVERCQRETVLVSGGRSRLVPLHAVVFVQPQENRSLQETPRSWLTKIPYFLFSVSTSKKGRSKNGSLRNFDNIADFGQLSGERCLLQ